LAYRVSQKPPLVHALPKHTLSAQQPLVLDEGNVCLLSYWWQTKLPPNEFTRLILKSRGPRRWARDLGSMVLGPWSVWIGPSKPRR
jgi:hypothetical protein